jgi:hypothetical protein
MRSQRIVITTTTISLAIFAALTALFLIPIPDSWHGDWAGFHIPFALSAVIAFLQCGTAVLFLSGLSAYKNELRIAYIMLVISIVLTAVSMMQLPIVSGFNLWQTFWATSGLIVMPFVLSGLVAYLGIRKLAQLVKVQTIFMKLWVTIPLVLLVTYLSIFLPHAPSQSTEITFDSSVAITVWATMLYLIAAIITLRVAKHIGEHYKNAMQWLATALLVAGIIFVATIPHALLADNNPADLANLLINISGIIEGFIWLKAGRAFNKTKEI